MSDEDLEEMVAVYLPIQRFLHMNFVGELVPDMAERVYFREAFEGSPLGETIAQEVNARLKAAGIRIRRGSFKEAFLTEASGKEKK